MTDARCPGCCARLPPARLVTGARFGCDSCAGLVLEVVEGRVREVPFASCPRCETPLEVPRGTAPGDTIRHCGRALKLTFEFGAWAATAD